jgi:hypothetical protein
MWKKGVHESEEQKRKIAEVLREGYASGKYIHPQLGKQRSEEAKRKTSETLLEGYRIGKYISPNVGRHFSKESKQKQSESLKKGYASGKYVGFWKDKHHPDEVKNKISETLKEGYKSGKYKPTMKGKHHTDKTRKKMSEQRTKEKHPLWGKHHSEETKKKMSLKRIGRFTGKNSSWYGKHLSDETKRKLSIANSGKNSYNYGKHFSSEHRHKQSISALRNWKDEDIAKKRIKSFGLKPNGLELYLDYLLQNYFPDEWKYVGDGQVVINGLCPDFINVNGKKKIIELFGHFWHEGKLANKGVSEHRTEAGKKKVFGEYGYDTLVIWDDELVDESRIIKKVNNFVK